MPRKSRKGSSGKKKRKGTTRKPTKGKIRRSAPKSKKKKQKFKVPRTYKKLTTKEIDKYEAAERIIGKQNLKKGTKRIGWTKFNRPSKAGLRGIRNIIGRITETGDFTKFSYDLRIEFTGKKGKKVRISKNGIGIPKYNAKRHRQINERRSRLGLSKLDRKEYFEEVVYSKVRRLVFGAIREVWGKYPSKKTQLKMTKGQVTKMLKTVKKQDARFSFGLNRES